MAGVKGRSGGARPNSGGKRPGAGRPRKNHLIAPGASPVAPGLPAGAEAKGAGSAADAEPVSPLAYLLAVVNDSKIDAGLRVKAALGAAPYVHGKATEQGKKEARKDAATKVGSSGKFAPSAAPLKLVKK